eukprot:Gb_00878 [translate_table: standard]
MPTSPLHRLSLDFLPLNFITALASCKGLLCRSIDGTPYVFYICNPATRTWLKLPAPNELKVWDFIALTFDFSTSRCSLDIGRKYIMQEQNNTSVEIYDSDTNSWTNVQMTIKKSVYPQGEGVYSKVIFYWINASHLGLTMSVYDVVAFKVERMASQTIQQKEAQLKQQYKEENDLMPETRVVSSMGKVDRHSAYYQNPTAMQRHSFPEYGSQQRIKKTNSSRHMRTYDKFVPGEDVNREIFRLKS